MSATVWLTRVRLKGPHGGFGSAGLVAEVEGDVGGVAGPFEGAVEGVREGAVAHERGARRQPVLVPVPRLALAPREAQGEESQKEP